MAGRRRLTTKIKCSDFWYASFRVDGRRFRQSLKTTDREVAERLAEEIRRKAMAPEAERAPDEMTLHDALTRYWNERGDELPSRDLIWRYSAELEAEFGKDLPLRRIAEGPLAAFASKLRRTRELSQSSVNGRLSHLRAVINRARKVWKAAVPTILWESVILVVPDERDHILSADEERRLFAALRADYHPMARFALASGLRVGNILRLRWTEIDWDAREITVKVKSKKPGGRVHKIPVTDALAAILSVERGRHPEFVFTYLCKRNRFDPERKAPQRKGQRYPFTRDGWRKAWSAALEAAGIEDFRFHDLRHTAATRGLRAVGNLKAVQKFLGHADIRTTLRYAKADINDVRSLMEASAKAHAAEITVEWSNSGQTPEGAAGQPSKKSTA